MALLLAWPINITAPGDHEKKSCGNVLETNLNPWRAPNLDGNYWEPAFRTCNSKALTGSVDPSGSSR